MKNINAEYNKHYSDSEFDFTIEFNVKNPNINKEISEDVCQFEIETNNFTFNYCKKCYNEILNNSNIKNVKIEDWELGGRSGGWFILKCVGDQFKLTYKEIGEIEKIVEKFWRRIL